MITKGKRISIAFELTIDGRLIKSIGAGRPFWYVQGRRSGNQIPEGLEKALKGMSVGDRRKVVLGPKEAYGIRDPKSFMEMPKSRFAKKDHIVGKDLMSTKDGKFLAKVKEVRRDTLVVDFNHPFAGKSLHYDVLVVGIEGEGLMPSKNQKFK